MSVTYVWTLEQDLLKSLLTECYEGKSSPLEILDRLHQGPHESVNGVVGEDGDVRLVDDKEMDRILSDGAWDK